MQIGIFGGAGGPSGADPLVGLTSAVRTAAEEGFGSFWTAQIFEVDALTALALAGRQVPGIQLGTAVVPTYPRHPMMLAQQALTVSLALGGRLRLGIGLSHQPVVEGMWGISFDRPVRHMSEYLDALVPLIEQRKVSASGQMITARGEIAVGDAPAVPVLVAALGEQMLKVAGKKASGTITWMVGPRTLAEHIVPTITGAAADAGRPAPQVVAGFPICVTDDVDAARRRAAKLFEIYGQLPSYRAMLDREGLSGPEDVALIGDEATVGAALDDIAATGATELSASEFGTGPADAERTRAFLASRAAR